MKINNMLTSEAVAVMRAITSTGRWTGAGNVNLERRVEHGISGVKALRKLLYPAATPTIQELLEKAGEAVGSGKLNTDRKSVSSTYAAVGGVKLANTVLTENQFVDPTCFTVNMTMEVSDEMAKVAADYELHALAEVAGKAREALLQVVISLEEEGVSGCSNDWVVGKLLSVMRDGLEKSRIDAFLGLLRLPTRTPDGLPDCRITQSGVPVIPPHAIYPGYTELIEKFKFRSRSALVGRREAKALKASNVFILPGLHGTSKPGKRSNPVAEVAVTGLAKLVKQLSDIPGYRTDMTVLDNFASMDRRISTLVEELTAARERERALLEENTSISKLRKEVRNAENALAGCAKRTHDIMNENVALRKRVTSLEPPIGGSESLPQITETPVDLLAAERFSAMSERVDRQGKTIDVLKETIITLLGQVN